MSIKSLIQIFILLLIIFIIGGIYYTYFDLKKNNIQEINLQEKENFDKINELERKVLDLELKNKKLNEKISLREKKEKSIKKNNIVSSNKSIDNESINNESMNNENIMVDKNVDLKIENKTILKKEVKNLVKNVEYNSIDKKGNRFNLLALSGKSNLNNNNILDLETVNGKITSDIRDTIFIVSDFAQYNSKNLNSKFYQNVIINYQDKEITCENFDINMETNKAIAYNNVIVTDPKSIMKAGIVEFDLITKNININPENSYKEIKVITN